MAGQSLDNPWVFAFGILGNIFSLMMYVAPLPTFYRVYLKKSTEGFQSVPYVTALFSAMLWIYYAVIKTDTCLLLTINSVGCIIETVYIVMYLVYATREKRVYTAKLLVFLDVGLFCFIVVFTYTLVKGSKRVAVLGWICVGFSVCVFAAPLSIIRLVVRTKSVEFMPFFLSLSLTLSAVMWFTYGLLTKDIYLTIPNILGFSFGVIQMVLYIIYKGSKKVTCDVQLPENVGVVAKNSPITDSELCKIEIKGDERANTNANGESKKETIGDDTETEISLQV